jgi:hypothetical protein
MTEPTAEDRGPIGAREQATDARLVAAGERWRSTLAAGSRVDVAELIASTDTDADVLALTPPPSSRRPTPRRRRWVVLAAAASVILAAAGITAGVLATRNPSHHHIAAVPDDALGKLTVADGAIVTASGVVFGSGKEWRLCVPGATADVGTQRTNTLPGRDPVWCWYTIATLEDGRRLLTAGETVSVTGRYDYATNTIAVAAVGTSHASTFPGGAPFPSTPCAAPAGGWKSLNGTPDPGDLNRLLNVVSTNQGDVSGLWISYPSSGAVYPNAEGGNGRIGIPTVGVTGDVAKWQAILDRNHDGPTCAYHVDHSAADLDQIADQLKGAALAGLSGNPNNFQTNVVWDAAEVEMRVVSATDARTLRQFGNAVRVSALIEPAG